jgi:D-alanyl-D-alanine carboxypeptidase/D-alanyl-D-alanine-endopeptidase (penicillin-binding protein 4)
VSAVALEFNTVTMHVTPGEKGGAALVTFAPEGFVDVTGRVDTGAAGTAQSVTLTIEPNGRRLRAIVGGSIPEDSRRLRFARRVDDPTLLAGYALKQLLQDQGIDVQGDAREGGAGARARLTMHESPPLHALVARLGKDSDNFAAEMLFKSLGGKEKRQGLQSADAVKVVRRYLEEIGVHDAGIVIRNGSGLFDSNRLTAHALTTVLRDMHGRPSLRHEFVGHLAVAGVDGTLRWRLRGERTRRMVRAKTGTLASVTALSGYVLSQDDGAPLAFAVLVNGVDGKVPGARAAVDRWVASIAERVWAK